MSRMIQSLPAENSSGFAANVANILPQIPKKFR